MDTAVATERVAGTSPRTWARIAGIFYLLNIVTGIAAAVLIASKVTAVGDAVNLVATGIYVVVTVILYYLFRVVNRSIALIAALFSLTGCAIGAFDALHRASFPTNSLVFFGVYCVLIGYLIFESTFLPRALGVLMLLAGLGWLTFISGPLAHALSPFNLLPGVVGESALTIWLLVVGVNVQRWHARAGAGKIVTGP